MVYDPEYQKQYRKTNSARLKLQHADDYQRNRKRYLAKNTEWRKNNLAQMRAKSAGLAFNITVADIMIPTHCPVLGLKLVGVKGKRVPTAPSLDRFDNKLGYVKGNVRVISWRANMLKRDGTLEEFEKIVAYMRN
jgi:hypothetical protein